MFLKRESGGVMGLAQDMKLGLKELFPEEARRRVYIENAATLL
jgi:hypothetical protein